MENFLYSLNQDQMGNLNRSITPGEEKIVIKSLPPPQKTRPDGLSISSVGFS